MRLKVKNICRRFAAVFVLLLLCTAIVWGGYSAPLAYASGFGYEDTNVLDDLEGSTIGGKSFDLSDYPFNPLGKPQIIAFAEYGYSFYSDNRADYGLYVYVYNPQGLAFDTETERNRINLAYAEKENWDDYVLQFLNYSTQPGYEGLFYKFKVVLTQERKADILSSVRQNARVYEIVGIELSVDSTVTDYTVAMRYTYSGYSLGYGSSLATESSLACTTDGFEKYLNLDVHTTYYRPEGTNGENDYTQDSLHSVYFAVPKETVQEYGALSAVHASWLDAVLAPVLVTGNKEAYEAIYKYLGQYVGVNNSALEYAYLGDVEKTYVSSGIGSGGNCYTSFYGYNMVDGHINQSIVGNFYDTIEAPEYRLNVLYWLFYAGDGENSADEYVIPSEEIEDKLETLTAQYGGELVNDRYSRVLFDSVADTFTNLNIPADYEYDLRNEVLGTSWWDKLWGITHDESDTFDGTKAIYAVSDEDFIYAGDEIDVEATCDGLLIAEQDFDEFKAFYDANNDDSVVYLFRYQVTDYIVQEATLFEGTGDSWSETDTNAYFMQQTVNLDFDIIDLTFTKDNVSTVIPVVSDPVDNIPDGTPPVNTTDGNGCAGVDWKRLLLLVGGVLAFILLLPLIIWLLPYLIKLIVWIVMLPFKAISAICKGIGKAAKKKPKDTGQSLPKTVYVKADKTKQNK